MVDHLLKAKVSVLYYQQNLSKKEIGENLRISRFKVAKLLEDAVKEGIVKIDIKEPENTYIDVENDLEEKYKIHRAVVVPSSNDYSLTRKDIGRAAANCLIDFIYDGDTVGIAWGTTIYEMVNALPEKIDKRNVSVVQITGGLDQVETKYNAIELSSRLANVYNSQCYHLYAPAIVDSAKTKDVLFSDSSIKRTLDLFNKVNVAVVGIGNVSPKPSTLLYKGGFLKDEDIKTILGNSAVGDINTYFYDENGKSCKLDLQDRAVGMNLEQLKRVRYVIGVAGGEFKVDAIYAALKGKIINILVTDHHTARQLLDK
jgi:DNA-binding transcriptional regulator LsrR (DeoR family)